MIQKSLKAFAIGTFMFAASAAFAQAAHPSPPANVGDAAAEHAGFVKTVQGTARLVTPSGEHRPLKIGDAVNSGHRIETDAGSGASVVLRDGTVMVIGPSSHLDLEQFEFVATTQDGGLFVSLVRGSLRMITGLLGKKPETVRVDTQSATIGIRGTDFIVTSDGRM